MNRKTIQSVKYFLIFFCLGLGVYLLLESNMFLSKPMVKEDDTIIVTGTVIDVASQVSPSIVGVTNLSSRGDMFNQRSTEATGSGVILDKEGHIVTNNHVVKNANRLIVTLVDGNEKEAKIVGTDPRTDLAVIKIEVKNKVTPAKFGDSDQLVAGQEVVAIGNPLGLRFARSVTAGVVSGLNRLITTEEGFVFRLIQTDAAINPGNSGGALVNLEGQVVGINTIKIAVPGFEGMGFSIPSKQVEQVVNDIIKNGRVLRPVMGIKILGEISKDQASFYNIPISSGIAVAPLADGPADKAGLKDYDIITAVNGEKVETGLELQEKIFARKIGEVIRVTLSRLPRSEDKKVKEMTVEVKLEKEK